MKKMLTALFVCSTLFAFAEENLPEDIGSKMGALVTDIAHQKSLAQTKFRESLQRGDLQPRKVSWMGCNLPFARENVNLFFPDSYDIMSSNGILCAYSLDNNGNFYWFGGFIEVIQVDPIALFDNFLADANNHPNTLLESEVVVLADGNWALDYTQYDSQTKETLKHRIIVTPTNVYFIDTDVTKGKKDYFNKFRDGVVIQSRW